MATVSMYGRSMVPGTATVRIVTDDHSLAQRAGRVLTAAGLVIESGRLKGARPERSEPCVQLAIFACDVGARLEAVRVLVEADPHAPVIVTLPADVGRRWLRRALDAGADGIVFEQELEQALAPSLHAVRAGQLAVPASLRRLLAPRHLSFREKQILSLVAIGYTNRQIADELILAESTIKTHLSSAFAKLEARSRAEATAVILDPEAGYSVGLALADHSARAA